LASGNTRKHMKMNTKSNCMFLLLDSDNGLFEFSSSNSSHAALRFPLK
jgi:hypothetical protein